MFGLQTAGNVVRGFGNWLGRLGGGAAEPPVLPLGRPPVAGLARDAIAQMVYPQPWFSPLDLDSESGREDAAMRLLYRQAYRREPSVRSAVRGKANSIASLDVNVVPHDPDVETDCRAAEFVKWAVGNSKRGWHGLIIDLLVPGFVDGWSMCELTLELVRPTDSREWAGFWGLRHARSLDTHLLRLQLDQYRNVTGVVNLVRGVQLYEPEKCLLYSHAQQFGNPFGQADLRASHRAVALIEDAYRAWNLAIRLYGMPFMVGRYGPATNRAALSAALEELRGGGFCVTSVEDEIEVLNLAGASSFDAFEGKVRALREDVYLAVRGVYLPFLEGQGGTDSHGDTGIHKVASDADEDVIAKDVVHLLNKHLVPFLVRPNFGPHCGLPRVNLGGTNWAEIKQQLEVAGIVVNELKKPVSAKQLYDVSKWSPPEGDADAVVGEQAATPLTPGGASSGPFGAAPPGTAAGATPTPGAPGQPAPAPAPPAGGPPPAVLAQKANPEAPTSTGSGGATTFSAAHDAARRQTPAVLDSATVERAVDALLAELGNAA